jgi:Mn-dependent DtxR family transcriptional regulator
MTGFGYDIEDEPIVLSRGLVNLLLQDEKPMEALSLYVFYYNTAKWQKTNKIRATTSYAAKGLNISKTKVRATKKRLVNLGLIQDIKQRDEKNSIVGHYIFVRFIWSRNIVEEVLYNVEELLSNILENTSDKKKLLRELKTHAIKNPYDGKTHTMGNLDTNALSIIIINALSNIIEDDSKESSHVFFKNANGKQNNKSSSEGKRRRRRKKPSVSMKERTRAKAQERAPKKSNKKKQPSVSKYVTDKNVQVVDLWNKKPHLRSHKKQDTKTYQDACFKLHLLQQGELYKHVSKESLQQDTDYEWFKRQWRRGEIAKAIHNLNEWCKEGNYPQKKDWIKKLSLSDAIFNPKTGTAPLLQAYMHGVKPIYDPDTKLESEVERRTYFNIYEFFSETMKKTDVTTKKQIVDLVKELQGRREAYRGSWGHYGGDFFGRHVDYPPYQADDLALDYMEFLRGNYPTDFIPHESLTPRGLKIGSYVWKEFCKAFDRKYGCDPIRGPIGDSYDPL